jgi:polyisoprenoid-binding protein YceI
MNKRTLQGQSLTWQSFGAGFQFIAVVLLGWGGFASSADAACTPWIRKTEGQPPVQVEWTGYKTTEKVAVQGRFEKIQFASKNEKGCTATEVLEGATAEVQLASVSSGNPVRDANLRAGFFALLSESGKAMAVMTQVKPKDGDSGSAVLQLTLLQKGKLQTHDIPLTYQLKGKPGERQFEATGSFDLLKVGAQNAVESIAHICKELHKGKDGVSKTWSEVGLKISAQVSQ